MIDESIRAVSDDGKRWRVEGPGWTMQPVGEIGVGEARTICERVAGVLKYSPIEPSAEQVEAGKQALLRQLKRLTVDEIRSHVPDIASAVIRAALSASREGDGEEFETTAEERSRFLAVNPSNHDERWTLLGKLARDLNRALFRSPDGWRATDERLDVIEAMRETMKIAGLPANFPNEGLFGYQHLKSMIDRAEDGNFPYGKQCRWLGWMQAAVVMSGYATLDDMQAINRRCQRPEPPVSRNEESST